MKKIIAALLTVVMIMTVAFAFASCSSKKYTDKEATIPVTDENGETVTDEQGKVATEVSTEPGKDGNTSSTVSASKANASSKASSTKKNESAKANKEDKTTKKASSTKKAEIAKKNETTTDKKETTTKETTTEKPEKREVIVRVQLPNSSDLKQAKLTIKYKTEKDKEYKALKIDDPNDKKNQLDYEVVKLDGKTVKKYSLGKIKGDVKVKVSISGVELTGNAATIKSNENSVTIAPASGIDIAIGKKD
jgi:hypothetical protein